MPTLSEQRRHPSLMKIRPFARRVGGSLESDKQHPDSKLIISDAKAVSVGAFFYCVGQDLRWLRQLPIRPPIDAAQVFRFHHADLGQ